MIELNFDYKNLIRNFVDICAVPRGSGHNRLISDFLCEFAAKHGLEYVQDEALNVVIKKPASAGFESYAPVVLQGHMDMVCVKNDGTEHDFETEGLELIREGNWLRANGTTLGGDDGIACAMMLSLLEDREAVHPALICVMTTDEETGMDGAKALDSSVFENAKYLLNLDSENENECLCGCAGGLRIDGRLPITRTTKHGDTLEITLSGLRGGHSGAEIHRNITNAIRLLGRILFELSDICDIRVISASGGEKDNAIPAYAKALVLLPPGYDESKIRAYIEGIIGKYSRREPDIKCTLSFEENITADTIDKKSIENILYVLLSMPDGVQKMSPDMEGLVETSLNLGIFETLDKEAVFHYSLRSSALGEKEFLSMRVRMILESAGGFGTENSAYPAWEYRPSSVLRDRYIRKYKEICGSEPKVTVIHAGVECGLFAEKAPALDMISIGPDMHDIHTPKERLDLESSIRLYKVVEALLPELT